MRSIETIINRQINHWDRIRSILKHPPASATRLEQKAEEVARPEPVIAFSRQLGSGSRLVAQSLKEKTGYEIFGCSLIEKVAEDLCVQRKIIDRLDESVRSHIETFIEGLLGGRYVDRQEYFRSLLRVLRAFVVQGGVILLGRGSTFVVDEGSGIRVRLIAPIGTRVRNLGRYSGLDEAAALEQIRESDRRRQSFIEELHGADNADPANYDLVINMERVSPGAATDLVLRALESLRP
jgi:cytidylate kinase